MSPRALPRPKGLLAPALALIATLAVALPAAADAAERPADTNVLQYGHTDIGPRMVDDELRLQARYERADGKFDWYDVNKTIFVIGTDAQVTLPQNNSSAIWGNPGDSVWRLPISQTGTLLWPGFSLAGAPDSDYSRHLTLSLDGITGPGDLVVNEETTTTAPLLSTRVGLPESFSFGNSIFGHFHTNWVVSQPGVYCLNLRVDGSRVNGSPVQDRAQLTLVTEGAADLDTVVPCAYDDAKKAPATAITPLQRAATGGTPVVLRDNDASNANLRLLPEVDDDELRAPLVQSETAYPRFERDPDDVVLYGSTGVSAREDYPWEGAAGTTVPGLTTLLGWSDERLDPDRVPEGATVELEGVTGADGGDAPGTLSATENSGSTTTGDDAPLRLSTDPRYPNRTSYDLRFDHDAALRWTASEPGVYCVALRFSATVDGAAQTTDTQRLTLVLDDPEHPTIDPTAVTPCGRTADAKPVVLKEGHVDLASRLIGDGLELSVRDQTHADGSSTYRALSGTVLAATGAARSTLPAGYGFLGAEGSRPWILPESNAAASAAGILWPGWSTDQIVHGRTTGGVAWTLTDVRGPGHFALWTSGDLGGEPKVLFSTRSALPQTTTIPALTHAHGNWGFTAAGTYCLDYTVRGTRADGVAISDTQTVTMAVGIDPATATPGACEGRPQPDPVSFMRGADSWAGTIKSGGKTRRAAKMVVLDVDHPD
ncbi:choice-of-anchor M domain-containing protein, partial [Patulibacter sp. S7RM1-6]